MLFIIGGKSNNTDIYETFRSMGDALREHFSQYGPTPLYVVVGRGGPNLVRGMGALAETCDSLGIPYRLFGFDSAISEVVNYAKEVDEWMRAEGRGQIAADASALKSPSDFSIGDRHVQEQASLDFRIILGVNSLEQVATRADRVCVLNILGGESRQVTPVSHAFSGGNVVFGTSPGRRGQTLPTPIGEIPVLRHVREGLDDGQTFDTGVVYLPPSGVRDGVAELIRVNPELKKIVMIT